MSDQSSPPGNNNNRPSGGANNNRRPNNQRRRPQGPNPNQGPGQNREVNAGGAPREGASSGGGQRRRHGRNHHNRPKNPNPQGQSGPSGNSPQHNNAPHGINIERIYEKYLNLLDQHLIARRKYHDLFYRAEPSQKNKLERNFYNTLNDLREFEARLAPEARVLFEKRNNGLSQDNIYATNHELPLAGENPPIETESANPHFLQSQQLANYADDKEESVGSADDYLKYKNLA